MTEVVHVVPSEDRIHRPTSQRSFPVAVHDPDMTRPGTVLVHPDQSPADPDACRIIAKATANNDWPWYRLTGRPTDLPGRDTDLDGWVPQSLADLGSVLGT